MSLHKLTAGDGYMYLIKQVAANDSTVDGGSALSDYYSSKGESPGVWLGSGLASLEDGPAAGDQVSAAQMKALFGEGRHPDADRIEDAAITAGASVAEALALTKLGKEFPIYTGASEFRTAVAEAFAAHNEARGAAKNARISEEVRAQIRTKVARDMFVADLGREPLNERELSGFVAKGSRQATTAVAGYDTTFSPVKSVSTLWAVAPREVSEKIEAAHDAAVRKAISWVEEHACKTRIGTAGVAQIDAEGLLATAFTHRDSRAGDPDLHTHVAISNKVRATLPDGTQRWLALDGRMIHKLTVAASEVYNTALEAEMRTRLRVRFADRVDADNGKRTVREIVGIDARLNAVFSSRRAAIDVRRGELAAQFQHDHGREPTPVEAIALAQQANLETRQAKHEPRSHAEQRAAWRSTALEVLGGEQGLSEMVRNATFPRRTGRRTKVNKKWIDASADTLIATVAEHRARWQRPHIVAEAQRLVRAANLTQRLVDPTVARLVAAALDPDRVVALGVRDEPAMTPAMLRRRNGESVYTTAESQVYTSESVLAAEDRIVTAATRNDGRVASATDVELALLEQAANRVQLNAGQTALVRQMATSGARVQLALAPAGTGKTTAMAALARAWENSGGTVLGLAPTAAAAAALREDLGAETDTMGKVIYDLDLIADGTGERPRPDWYETVGPDTLVVVDEAGMASTGDLDRVIEFVISKGGSVRLVGDDQQLASVAAGGVLRDIDATCGSVTLNHVVRFKDPAEGAASLALRAGDPAAIGFYIDHGRVHVSDKVAAEDAAYTAWKTDRVAGLDAVMLAPTRDAVKGLNERARTDRIAAAGGEAGPEVMLADELNASAGDIICTRRNNRRLMLTATDFVRNGDRWTVAEVHPDGSVTATRIGDASRTIVLPADYVREHTMLGYARTIHGAQGITADACHTIATGSEDRQLAYVAMTRGKQANHLYLGTAHDGDDEKTIHRDTLLPPTAVDVFTAILGRDGAQKSATTTARELADPALRLADAAAAYDDAVGTAAEHRLGADELARLDTAAEKMWPGLTDAPAYPVLRRHLATLAVAGADPVQELQSAVAARELKTAVDPAAVLDWRLDPSGNHSVGRGPLPWLPAIPAALAADEVWGEYLTARSALVTDLAGQVRTATAELDAAAAPAWARPLLAADETTLAGEVAVMRAAFTVADTDRRPTGPARFAAAQRRAQQRLDTQVAAIIGDPAADTGRWKRLADELDPRIVRDPFWPDLAEKLSLARNAGVDVAALARRAVADRPLPDELPAAALWWRLSQHLSPASLDRAGGDDLHPVWEAQLDQILDAKTAAIVRRDPAWPSLVAAIDGADPSRWTPAELLGLAADLADLHGDGARVRRDQITTALVWRIDALTHHVDLIGADAPLDPDEPLSLEDEEAAAVAAGVGLESDLPHAGAGEVIDPWTGAGAGEFTDADAPLDDETVPPPPDEHAPSVEDLDAWAAALLAEARPTAADRYSELPSGDRLARLQLDLAAARGRVEHIWVSIRDGAGEHLSAAMVQVTDMQRRADEQRPLAAAAADAHRLWMDLAVEAEIVADRAARLARDADRARAEGEDDAAAGLDAEHALAAMSAAAHAAEADDAHRAYLDAQDQLQVFAADTGGVVTAEDVEVARLAAMALDTEALTAARREVTDLQGAIVRAEHAAARDHTTPAPPLTLAPVAAEPAAEPGAVAVAAPPATLAEQITDYTRAIRDAYDERTLALLGQWLPERNLDAVQADRRAWRQVTYDIARADMAGADTDALARTAVGELSKKGRAKAFDKTDNTPAKVLARELAAARGPARERTDELRYLGVPTPPPGTDPHSPVAVLAESIATGLRREVADAERAQPEWLTALGDPGDDARRRDLRRDVATVILSHRLRGGAELTDPDPMAGIDDGDGLRTAAAAVDGNHYRRDFAQMSDRELSTSRSVTEAHLVETRALLASGPLRRARTEAGLADLDRALAALEDTPQIRQITGDLAAIDAERTLRTITGYTPDTRRRTTPPATTTSAADPLDHDRHRDSGRDL